MDSIGGYFELELNRGRDFYPDLIKLNTGRNCLEYILRAKKYKKIILPFYTCDVLLEPLRRLNIEYEFYQIDQRLDPATEFQLEENDVFLYTNYFGIKSDTAKKLSKEYTNLILDNSQAFFAPPETADTFYSARKFFGVPDGAYLYTDKKIGSKIPRDISCDRFAHLIKRIDQGASLAYDTFKANRQELVGQRMKTMSRLTERLLGNIDYPLVKRQRESNFLYLHDRLKDINELHIDFDDISGPMAYPLLLTRKNIKEKLIKYKIFVPTYWPNVLSWVSENAFEYQLATYLLPLPIDQRYGNVHMEEISDLIFNFIQEEKDRF